jgi:outer membrane protein OmpA-like peptidoglycan-associated protein
MSRHLFFVSLLCAALSFSCFGQNNSTSSSSSQAASPQSSSDLEPLPPQSKGDFWDGDDPNLLNLVTHPFANKKYVQRMTRPIKDRLEELDSITTENSSRIKDVDARAQHGLQLASEKTTLADNHATDATTRAQQAQSAATDASNHVSMAEKMVGSLDQYKSGAQTEIRFRAGQTVLSKQAKDALDDMAAGLKDQRSYIVEVQGFASGRGQAAIASSQKMADSVVRYLVLSHQIPVYRMYVLSMGNSPAPAAATEGTTAKHVNGGRVEISVMKNDLATAQR